MSIKQPSLQQHTFLYVSGIVLSIFFFILALVQVAIYAHLYPSETDNALPQTGTSKENPFLLNKSEWNIEVVNASDIEGLEKVAGAILEDAGYQMLTQSTSSALTERANTLLIREDMKPKQASFISDLRKYFNITTVEDNLPFSDINARLILTSL